MSAVVCPLDHEYVNGAVPLETVVSMYPFAVNRYSLYTIAVTVIL